MIHIPKIQLRKEAGALEQCERGVYERPRIFIFTTGLPVEAIWRFSILNPLVSRSAKRLYANIPNQQ